MALPLSPDSVVALHDTGTDFRNAHATDPVNILGVSVNDMLKASRPLVQVSDVTTGGSNANLSATQLSRGIIESTPTGGDRNLILPTAAVIINNMNLTANNMSFRFIVRNLQASTHGLVISNSADSSNISLNTDAGSSMTVANAKTSEFLIRRTGSGAVAVYQIAGL